MSLLHYIDNEVPEFGQWTAIVEAGTSTIVQSPSAAFPERGGVGLRVISTTVNGAYVRKTIATGQTYLAIGTWFRMPVIPSDGAWLRPLQIREGGLFRGGLSITTITATTFEVNALIWDDLAAWQTTPASSATFNHDWHYLVLVADGTGGQLLVYVDGILATSKIGIDIDARVAAIDDVTAGHRAYGFWDDAIIDLDEIKIATAYPESYVPTPESEYPNDPARTCPLYRIASADSATFAGYCVDELGAPRANVCGLPNATANESLADYATFQTEIETDLAAWLATNSTVAGNVTTFLPGYGVPGYFTDAGTVHSATSRLMRYGLAFSSMTANPFYNPSTVARLTATDLQAASLYCALRIDGANLAAAQEIVDDGVVASHVTVPDAEIFYHYSLVYIASLDCQHLRIQTSNLTVLVNDALTDRGAEAVPTFGSAGSRVSFLHNRLDSADSLRGGAASCYQALTEGYASAMGFTLAPEHEFATFFEMLRIGGSLAEAMMVGSQYLDYTNVHVGIPGIGLEFSTTGYNVYRGASSALNIDYDTPVAYLRQSDTTASLVGLGHSADSEYVYAIRPVWRDIETPDIDTIVTVVMDGAGDWEGNRPDAVIYAGVGAESGGDVRVYWSYTPGGVTPDDFAVWCDTDSDVDVTGAPDATVTYSASRGEYSHTFSLTDGSTYWFAIAARSGAINSEVVTVGPKVADATGPAAPDALIASSF